MSDPLFWLGLSVGLLALSLAVLLLLAIPALVSLTRAARSAEILLDMLNHELPRTLRALQQTGADLGTLAEDMTTGVQSARHIVTQVDRSVTVAQQQAAQAQRTTRSLFAGAKAAWAVLTLPTAQRRRPRRRPPTRRPSSPPVGPSPAPPISPDAPQLSTPVEHSSRAPDSID